MKGQEVKWKAERRHAYNRGATAYYWSLSHPRVQHRNPYERPGPLYEIAHPEYKHAGRLWELWEMGWREARAQHEKGNTRCTSN